MAILTDTLFSLKPFIAIRSQANASNFISFTSKKSHPNWKRIIENHQNHPRFNYPKKHHAAAATISRPHLPSHLQPPNHRRRYRQDFPRSSSLCSIAYKNECGEERHLCPFCQQISREHGSKRRRCG